MSVKRQYYTPFKTEDNLEQTQMILATQPKSGPDPAKNVPTAAAFDERSPKIILKLTLLYIDLLFT
jgi:hypothetical protein